ncbi:hypothetical protein GCM10027089_39950 [Nocardia thraciensis]
MVLDVLRGLLQGEEPALAVDGEQAIELLFGHLGDRLIDDLDTGVGDHDVDLPECLHRLLEQALESLQIRDIGLDRDRLRSEVFDLLHSLFRVASTTRVVDHHAGTERGVAQRDRSAYPSGRAGNDSDLVLQIRHVYLPSL